MPEPRRIVLSGCSGGGKSTLLAELRRRGFSGVEEAGRRTVAAALVDGDEDLPWIDMAGFARRAMALAERDYRTASGLTFFDRSLIDLASALQTTTGEPALERLARDFRYDETVFLAPPWPEIYAVDSERRHGLAAAITEYERLERAYPALGYKAVVLPKVSVAERADLVLATIA